MKAAMTDIDGRSLGCVDVQRIKRRLLQWKSNLGTWSHEQSGAWDHHG